MRLRSRRDIRTDLRFDLREDLPHAKRRKYELVVACDCSQMRRTSRCRNGLLRMVDREGILGDDFLNLGANRRRAVDAHGCAKFVQLPAQRRPVFQRPGGALDFFTRRRNHLLLLVEKLLVKLFPFAQTCESYFYFVLGPAGKSNQSASQFNDPNGFAHIQYEDVAMLSDHEALQHQRNGFAGRHEESSDVRMRHGQWFVVL